MGTHAHKLTPLRPTSLPRRFILFSSQPCVSREMVRPVQLVHRLRIGALRYLHRDGVCSWSMRDDVYDTTPRLLALLDRYASRRETTWVVCRHLAYQWVISGLGISGIARQVDVTGYNFSGRVKTARLKIGGKVLHLVDAQNYLDQPLDWIAAALGSRIPPPPDDTDSDSSALDRARLECAALGDFIVALSALAGSDMEGAWGWSLGSMAWRSYRAGLMADPIHVHADTEATALERAAYLGGRNECRYIGSVGGTVRVADYNSLYAARMVADTMPTRLLGVHAESVASLIRGLDSGLCAIAQVTVDARKYDYPYLFWPGSSGPREVPSPLPAYCAPSTQWRRIWGRGVFTTTLATPELKRAVETGEVRAVSSVAWYAAGDAFGRFVGSWYAQRLAYREKARPLEEAVCKRILTVLPGKFGQHARDWTDCPDVACQLMTGHWWSWDNESGDWQVYRALHGCAQVYGVPGEWRHSCPAISAHVCSSARVATDQAVAIAGDYDCYYYDTDALHVSPRGWDRLRAAGLTHETDLGRLKLKGEHNGGCWRNSRDFSLGSEGAIGRTAGCRDHGTTEDQPAVAAGSDFDQFFRAGADAWRNSVAVTAFSRYRYSGRVNPLGWVQPLWVTPNHSGELFRRRK